MSPPTNALTTIVPTEAVKMESSVHAVVVAITEETSPGIPAEGAEVLIAGTKTATQISAICSDLSRRTRRTKVQMPCTPRSQVVVVEVAASEEIVETTEVTLTSVASSVAEAAAGPTPAGRKPRLIQVALPRTKK